MNPRPPLRPFTEETVKQKVQMAEDGWNTGDPQRVAMACTEDTEWRNRAEFLRGREEVKAFLRRKWSKEFDYRLRTMLWEFDEHGYMAKRYASINDQPIQDEERMLG